MARQYVVTDVEMKALIEGLELEALRADRRGASMSVVHKPDIDGLHRIFHYHVVKWAQSMGFTST